MVVPLVLVLSSLSPVTPPGRWHAAQYVSCDSPAVCEFKLYLGFGISTGALIGLCDIDVPAVDDLVADSLRVHVEEWIRSARQIVVFVAMVGNRELVVSDRVMGWVLLDGKDLSTKMLRAGMATWSKEPCYQGRGSL